MRDLRKTLSTCLKMNLSGAVSLALVLASVYSIPAFAGSVDSAAFCVTETEMQFDVEVTSVNVDTGDVNFNIVAEGNPFVSPVESITANFDPVTGLITRAEGQVRTSGAPEFDRWVDGLLNDFTIENVSGRRWRIFGTATLGNDKLLPDDMINGVVLREFQPYVDAVTGPYTITACQQTNYSVGGNISALTGSMVLQNNGGDDLVVSANGGFIFVTSLADLSPYLVTVLTQPTGQTCNVTNGNGTVSGANITDITVDCVDDVIPPVTPPLPATPVPTLSIWALLMLFALMGLVVVANRKRFF